MSQSLIAIGTGLDALLTNAFHAYRLGLRRQPRPESQVPPRGFDRLKFLGTIGWIPVEQRLRLDRLHSVCAKGLFATRDGRLDTAVAYYGRAGELLEYLAGGTRLTWFLGVSTYEAGLAYLDFRRERVELARERLDRAMDADLELEQAGLPVMLMHRIQQGHNLTRMDLRLGQRAAAFELGGTLAAYMERCVDTLPFHRNWGYRSLQAVSRSMLRSMIHQIIAELAGHIVTGRAPEEEWLALVEAARLRQDPETAVSPQVQFALRAQYHRWAGAPEDYLRDLERLFSLGIRHCHLLWYAVLVELVDFCRELDTRPSLQVRDVLLRDSAKWKEFPPFLRDRLEGPAPRRHVA